MSASDASNVAKPVFHTTSFDFSAPSARPTQRCAAEPERATRDARPVHRCRAGEALVVNDRLSRTGKLLSRNAKGPQRGMCWRLQRGCGAPCRSARAGPMRSNMTGSARDGDRVCVYSQRGNDWNVSRTRGTTAGERRFPGSDPMLKPGAAPVSERIATICDDNAYRFISTDIFHLRCTSILIAAGMGFIRAGWSR